MEEKASQTVEQEDQRTKIGMRKMPKTCMHHWYCFLHLTDEETEAQRSKIIFPMATLA